MKQCPKCGQSYADETQNFCLDDGTWLVDPDPQTAILPAGLAEAGTKLFDSSAFDPTISMSGVGNSNSIAVLPFAHLSSDADDEYFCDGLAEELIGALARVDGLKVVARTSAFSFRGKNIDIAQIGSKLKVHNIVEGSVRKFGNRMRIMVQLVNASDGYHIWSDKFDTEMRDLFDVQDEITLSVVNALKSKLLGKADTDDQMASLIEELKQHAHDVDAYQLYLRGRHFSNTFTPEGFYKAAEFFNKAIDKDPNFAAAYAALADVHVLLTEFGNVPSLDGLPKAKEAALKAIALDPSLSEAHMSLALVLQEFDFDFAGAEREYELAIELNPNNAMAHQYYGALLVQMGRVEKAEKRCRKAIDLDPLSVVGTWVYAFALFLSRRYDEAIDEANRLLSIDPNFSAAFLSLAFASQMRSDYQASVEAYARFLELCGLPELASAGRNAFEAGGWEAFLRAMTADEASAQLSSYITAVYHAALGDRGAAFFHLERSLAKREGFIVMLKMDPRFEAIHEDPRFQNILREIGFPE